MTNAECPIAFYISGHGFGHASRQVEIINALHRLRPDVSFVIRSEVSRRLLDRTINAPFEVDPRPCDTGVVQIDALHLDARATIERARDFYGLGFDARVQAEARLLRDTQVGLVVSDAPALACAAAHHAGITSIVISNFTWDWIYEEYREYLADAPDLIPTIRRAYAHAREAWRLPMYGGFDAFETIRNVSFVARHARHTREDVRRHLGLPRDSRLALSSFGGYDVNGIDLGALDTLSSWTVVVTTHDSHPVNAAGVVAIPEERIYHSGLRYEDLVAACDVVVTKPGYGIVSECVANGTALVYTDRGRFAEYAVLVAEMPKYLRCAYIDQTSLRGGRWRSALDAAVNAPAPAERPSTDGADIIAGMMSALCSLDETSSGPPPQR
jgi:hypothetical protein